MLCPKGVGCSLGGGAGFEPIPAPPTPPRPRPRGQTALTRSPARPPPSLGPQIPPREQATLSRSAPRPRRPLTQDWSLSPAGCALPRLTTARSRGAGDGVGGTRPAPGDPGATDLRAPPVTGNPTARSRPSDSVPGPNPGVAPPRPRAQLGVVPPKASALQPRGHSRPRSCWPRIPASDFLPGQTLPARGHRARDPTPSTPPTPSSAGFAPLPGNRRAGWPGSRARSGHRRPEDPRAWSESRGRRAPVGAGAGALFPERSSRPAPSPASGSRPSSPYLTNEDPRGPEPRKQSATLVRLHCPQDGFSRSGAPTAHRRGAPFSWRPSGRVCAGTESSGPVGPLA